jgi:hypothetical protein
MFCPEYKAEYQPGFIRCGDCGVELVEHLEDPEVAGFDDVVVATAKGPFEDAQICSFLEANGIPARIRSETLRKTHVLGSCLFRFSCRGSSHSPRATCLQGPITETSRSRNETGQRGV